MNRQGPKKIDWTDYRKGNHRIHAHSGYVLVYCPDHPHAKSKGHIYEHRYEVEKNLGRFLKPNEQIHHKNENPSDNRIENLELMSSDRNHKKHHKRYPKEAILALFKLSQLRKKPRKIIKCECGCGGDLETPDKKGRMRKYLPGHNAKNKHWKWRKNEQAIS